MIGQSIVKAMLVPRGQLRIPVRTMYPQMSGHVIAGMPQTRIPFAEKVLTGIFISACILATPAWVLTHLDEYRGSKAEVH